MPSPPKVMLPKSVVFISTRIQEGLPLVTTKYMQVILESILARAQKKYRVTVCHFLFMRNHLHILLLVENPEYVPAFMDRIKTESAHAINRLLGRRQRTVWCSGYDSPPVLTLEDVILKINYLYTNPQSADLTDTIEQYPGFSSWDMFTNNKKGYVAKWIRRPFIKKLSKTRLSESEQEKVASELLKKATKRLVFRLSPNAWMKTFGITEEAEIQKINKQIINLIRLTESDLRAKRAKLNKEVIGEERLKAQPMDASYTPRKFGKKMLCICHDKNIRISFINFVKDLIAKAREVKKLWSNGDFSVKYPFGLFPPRIPRLGNLMPYSVRSFV